MSDYYTGKGKCKRVRGRFGRFDTGYIGRGTRRAGFATGVRRGGSCFWWTTCHRNFTVYRMMDTVRIPLRRWGITLLITMTHIIETSLSLLTRNEGYFRYGLICIRSSD
jgi:hypothetical protein